MSQMINLYFVGLQVSNFQFLEVEYPVGLNLNCLDAVSTVVMFRWIVKFTCIQMLCPVRSGGF